MIESFKHKGLQELFEKGKTSRLPHERLGKIKNLLAVLDSAHALKDLNAPAFRLHKLKKPPLDGYYSIDVSGNYRLVFDFDSGNVNDLDYLDTH
jgi:proteic killer suppression protein